MSLINTCSTAAAALLKNTENRTSSRPTYDIFLACFALCSFLGLLKQFFVYKTCTIPMFWKNSRDRGGVGQHQQCCHWFSFEFMPAILGWCELWCAGAKWGFPLFVFLGHRPWLWHSSPTHYFDWQIKGGRRRQQCDTFRNPRKIREYLILGLGLNAQWFFLQAHFKRVPITLLCVLCMSSTNWFRECSSSALICSTHHWQIRW